MTIYHHPDHDRNLDSFVRNLKASLAYFTALFGPNGPSDLRMVEVPRYHREVRSHLNELALSEGRVIAHMREGQADPLFFGTAQEIAPQWWGCPVRSASDGHEREDSLRNRLRATAP